MVNEIYSNSSVKNIKDQRMTDAVSVCAELFLDRGIEKVRMTDIAGYSGVGVATLYRHFGTKTGISIAAMTFLWNDLGELFNGIFETEPFISKSGIDQIRDLLKMFIVMFKAHKSFMKILGEFDRMVIRENIPKEALKEYESSVINFYPLAEKSYKKGLEDGTVKEGVNFPLFYVTCAHSLMEMCKKFISGEILPSDNFSTAEHELEMIIDFAVNYIKK